MLESDVHSTGPMPERSHICTSATAVAQPRGRPSATYFLALNRVHPLVLLRGAHLADAVRLRLVPVPPRDENVPNRRIHAVFLGRPRLDFDHVLKRVELANERRSVRELVHPPPAASDGGRLRGRAPDELHAEVGVHRADFGFELVIRAPAAAAAAAVAAAALGAVRPRAGGHLEVLQIHVAAPSRAGGHLPEARLPRSLAGPRQKHRVALHQTAVQLLRERGNLKRQLPAALRRSNHDVHRREARLLEKLLHDELQEVKVVAVNRLGFVVYARLERVQEVERVHRVRALRQREHHGREVLQRNLDPSVLQVIRDVAGFVKPHRADEAVE
eukprot:26343-Pelagococcus_subviridis.AAC.2